jgi:hypothetical protein
LRAVVESFEEKRSFESRLGKIERIASSTLGGFYEPHLKSFSVKPGSFDVSCCSWSVAFWLIELT